MLKRLLSHSSVASNLLRNVPKNPSSPFLRSVRCPETSHSLAHIVPDHSPHFLSQNQRLFPKKISGLFSSSIVSERVLANTLLKVITGRSLAASKVGFLTANFPRRGFSFSPSFDSRRRWKSWLPEFNANGVVLNLIITNVAVFILWRLADSNFMKRNFMISLPNIMAGRLHTMITSAFSHIEAEHLISNMIGLYFFGMNIARVFGPEFVLKLYFAGAIGGSVFFLAHKVFLAASSKANQSLLIGPSSIPALGASGAVNAIMLLNIFLFPKATLYLEFIIPVPAALLGIFLIGKDVLSIIQGDTHISGAAHLGGAAVAAIAWARIRRGHF